MLAPADDLLGGRAAASAGVTAGVSGPAPSAHDAVEELHP